jgi:hypothetical protein
MPEIDRRNLVLLLVGIDPKRKIGEGIGGITRLQKLLYLLEQEENLKPTASGFEFTAYKAGPYSSKLYDDLEFLENIGLLESEVAGEAEPAEASEVDLLNFDELIDDSAEDSSAGKDGLAPDAYEERRFRISEDGIKRIEKIIDSGQYTPVIDGIRKIKRKYGNYSLSDLLYYVYTKYPDMTVESEIKDKVLRKRRNL